MNGVGEQSPYGERELNIATFNVRGYRSNEKQVEDLWNNEDLHILVLQETYLPREKFLQVARNFESYCNLISSYSRKLPGATTVLIHKSIDYKLREKGRIGLCEFVAIKLSSCPQQRYHTFYRH